MKRLTVVMIFLMLGLGSLVSANEDIGVFANLNTNCIQFIDPVTNTATEPLLAGELGSTYGGLLDVVITSDGKTAIVSNFGDSRVFFIDISGGFNTSPTILGSARTKIFAEDLAITPDGKYVLVTDGAFSPGVAVIEIATRKYIHNNNLGWRDAQAVAITPDGETVLVVDYFGGAIHAYTLRGDGILIHKKSINVLPFWPINVSISPDGRTVIVPLAFASGCVVLYFDTEGNLFKKGVTSLPAKSGQSCVFCKDGTKAYYLSNSQAKGTRVHILEVTGPGQVSATDTSITITPRRGIGQLFGVDTLALDPSENYLYVTNPNGNALTGIAIIDLTTNTHVGHIQTTGFPTGIAFATIMSDGE
jgi:DNA-binding beta-propeller fold protein YncE